MPTTNQESVANPRRTRFGPSAATSARADTAPTPITPDAAVGATETATGAGGAE